MKVKSNTVILGHDIALDIDLDAIEDLPYRDEIIDKINQSILDGDDAGFCNVKTSCGYLTTINWKMIEELSYLDEKVEILKQKEQVVFEHNQKIHQVYLTNEDNYIINVFDLSIIEFSSGDELESIDGGTCSGSARDAVYYYIEKEV